MINVSSDDSAESEYVIEELSVLFVNSLKYTVEARVPPVLNEIID
jgi:hypothetical protein